MSMRPETLNSSQPKPPNANGEGKASVVNGSPNWLNPQLKDVLVKFGLIQQNTFASVAPVRNNAGRAPRAEGSRKELSHSAAKDINVPKISPSDVELVLEAAALPDQPLGAVRSMLPSPEKTPILASNLMRYAANRAKGVDTRSALVLLREQILNGATNEFAVAKKIFSKLVKDGNEDLFFGTGGASSGAPTVVERLYNPVSDPLQGSVFEEILKQTKFSLETDADPTKHDTHKLARVISEIEEKAFKARYDDPLVKAQVKDAKARIQRVIDETRSATEEPTRIRSGNVELPVEEKDRYWLYDKDSSSGKPIIPGDKPETLEDGTTRVRNFQPLRDVLHDLESGAYVRDEHAITAMYGKLMNLVHDPKYAIYREDVDPYVQKLTRHLNVLKDLHWTPNAVEMEKIKNDWTERDNMFYERIRNVLDTRFETARDVMNLYTESGVDAFIEAVRNQCGTTVAQHYDHLKKSIYFMHDLEQIARGSAGEVEVLKKLMGQSSTTFMIEGTSDPLTMAFISSYEQALRKVLRDNNGYLPPELFEFNPKTGRCQWDDLAEQFLRAKVAVGGVFDSLKDENKNGERFGLGVLRPDNIGYKRGRQITLEDLEGQPLRIQAARNMAKGIGVFDNRILELFATAKAPGFETSDTTFSSIPYEGIARFFRPMGHLYGKYKMGVLSHNAIMATMIGGKIPELVNLSRWSPNDWKEVHGAVSEGTLSSWLKKKYGEKLGEKIFKEAKPFIEIQEDFMWTGRFGPHSAWGHTDSTLYFTDKKRELVGGSMMLTKASWWAERYLTANDPHWSHEKHTLEGAKKLKKLEHAYRAWTWAQLTLRNPMVVAENVYKTEDGLISEDKKSPNLRKILVNEILNINLDTDVATEATPNINQSANAARIAILDADIAAIQYLALYGGPSGEPREILESDFLKIIGEPIVDPRSGKPVITAEMRREQAKKFIFSVRKHMFGNSLTSIEDWQGKLGVSFGAGYTMDAKFENKKAESKDMLHISKYNEIYKILEKVREEGGLLGIKPVVNDKPLVGLITHEQTIFMGQDDTRLGDMDLGNLGSRAFGRLINDLESRKGTSVIMAKLLDMFTQEPNEKKFLETLQELWDTEKGGRGPQSAQAFIYYFARLYGEYYRGSWASKMPITGKLFQRFMDQSIAQTIHGRKNGTVWSSNNLKHFLHQVGGIGALEHEAHGHVKGAPEHKFSIERLERELLATDTFAYGEAIIIGYFIVLALTAALAATKAKEEEEGGGHH